VTRDKQTLSVGQCTVFDTDDDNKPILWQKLSQLQGCAPIHKPTTAMPSQAPTYSGPQINLKAKYYDDSLCSHQTGEEQTYLPKDRCIDIPYDPYFPDDPRSARAECIGNNGVEYTQYNKTSCSVVKDTIKLIIGECIVSDTDENGTPNEWMEVVELDGCSPTHKPTPAMPSQAPTYYGPQIEVKLHKFYNSSCTNRTDDPPESDSIVKDRCIDDQEDGSSRKYTCFGDHDGFEAMGYNNTNCPDSGLFNRQTVSVGDCFEYDIGLWAKLVKLEGCGSKKSESFFNLENSLLIGGFLFFLMIIGIATFFYCRKGKDDGPYSALQN